MGLGVGDGWMDGVTNTTEDTRFFHNVDLISMDGPQPNYVID